MLSPVSALPLGSTSTAVCCRARHGIRAGQTTDAAVSTQPAIVEAPGVSHPTAGRVSPDIAKERNILQLRVIYLSHRFGISQIPAGERGWTRGPNQPTSLASGADRHGHTCCKHERWHVDSIVYEVKTDRVCPHGRLFPRQLVSHSPTHWVTARRSLGHDRREFRHGHVCATPWGR